MANSTKQTIGISGIGQRHTDKYGKSFADVSLKEIRSLVDNPQAVDKSEAKWAIFSTHHSRVFKEQEQHGQYWMLWFDLDESPPSIEETVECFDDLKCNYEIYTSRSASIEVQKSRIILPLDKPLGFFDWHLYQEVINDWMDGKSIIPDRANERAAQLCYLPNKGAYYNAVSERNKPCIDPESVFATEIANKKKQRSEALNAAQKRSEEAKARRDSLNAAKYDSPIDAFNDAYEVEQILLDAGYDKCGTNFRHPNSESGSYSANVKLDNDGKHRVHSLSTADPLFSDGEGAHDAFSTFCVLNHNGNSDDALKDAGDNWLKIGKESWNTVKQREYREKQNEEEFASCFTDKSPTEVLRAFSATGQSETLRKKMLDDVFVLKDLAILGQWTTFYAAPNTGKTLLTMWLISEQIKDGKINPDDVFYVNVDDTYKGGVEKTEIAERVGFHMLLPNVNDFNKNNLFSIVNDLIKADEASGKIIILDTLKKFVEIMDKTKASEFGENARDFGASGGTLICLAHTNKHKDQEGKSIFSGTADIVDDNDCSFIIESLGSSEEYFGTTETRVEFREIKSRGDVAEKLAFAYTKEQGAGYLALFDSVKYLDESDITKAKERANIQKGHEQDREIIDAVTQHIRDGIVGKTELIAKVHEDAVASINKIKKTLKRWEGEDREKGHLWYCEKRDKNLTAYCLTKSEMDEVVSRLHDDEIDEF
jgi:hypothetical protein